MRNLRLNILCGSASQRCLKHDAECGRASITECFRYLCHCLSSLQKCHRFRQHDLLPPIPKTHARFPGEQSRQSSLAGPSASSPIFQRMLHRRLTQHRFANLSQPAIMPRQRNPQWCLFRQIHFFVDQPNDLRNPCAPPLRSPLAHRRQHKLPKERRNFQQPASSRELQFAFRMDIKRSHRDRRAHLHFVANASRKPYRARRRYDPGFPRRRHTHHARHRKQQLASNMAVLRDPVAGWIILRPCFNDGLVLPLLALSQMRPFLGSVSPGELSSDS